MVHTETYKPNPIQIQKHLGGIDYPASKQDLIEHAQENGAPEDIMSLLGQLPDDEFETPAAVNKAIGKLNH